MMKSRMYDMTVGSPAKLMLQFAVPLLIGNLFQQLYNMVDSVVVGQFIGANALGAVGATGSIINLFFGLTNGLANGIGIIIAQFYGAKNEVKVRKSIMSCIYLMSATALVMGTLGVVCAPFILRLLNTPDGIIEGATVYMQVNCAGMLALAAYNGMSAILRALGNSRTPLIFLIISSILNVILDLIFVLVFGWAVFGVGLATIMSQAISALLCILYVIRRVPYFRINKEERKPDKELIKRCICFGIPLALQSSLISASIIILQRVVNGFGETVVAAFTAGNRFEQLVQQPFMSLGAALATFTGQNVGAGKWNRVKRGYRTGLMLAAAFALVMMPVAVFGGGTIMRMFTSEAEVIRVGARGIQITSMFYIPLGILHVTRNIMNGSGDTRFPMMSGIVEMCGRVGLAKPLTMIPYVGIWGIWLTTGFTWIFTCILGVLRYHFTRSRK